MTVKELLSLIPEIERSPSFGKFPRSDFFITLSSMEKDGFPVDDLDLSSVKAIAVYMDGYTFHATEENQRFADDFNKRKAILESNAIISCTLTWSDLEKFDAIEKENDTQSKNFKRDFLYLDRLKYQNPISIFRDNLGSKFLNEPLLSCRNTFERLLWILSNPLNLTLRNKKIGLMLSMFQHQFGSPSVDVNKVDDIMINSDTTVLMSLYATDMKQDNFYVIPEISTKTDFSNILVAVKVSDFTVKTNITISNVSNKLDKEKWENFWQLFNVVQEFTL